MDKKKFIEKMREQLELKLQEFNPNTVVTINYCFTRLIVVFPADKKSIFYLEMNVIAEAGNAVWVSYCKNHLEVEVRVF